MAASRKLLELIEVHHREWPGGRNRRYSTIKTKLIAGRMPVDLINQINRLNGRKSFHLEKALRLYVTVRKRFERSANDLSPELPRILS